MFASINPATGAEIATYEAFDGSEIDRRLDAAWSGWQAWRQTSMEERTVFLERLAGLLEEGERKFATLISTEMGKPLKESTAEIRKCALTARHYASHGPGYLSEEDMETDARRSQVAFEPLGPVLAVMPWNFPFWQVMRFFIPAALAGNVGLLKHAENVQGCAAAIEEVIAEAAGRGDLLVNLRVGVAEIARLIADDRIRAVTLTGSVGAGRSVAAAAGAVGKKAVLELGGSDPFIVLEDADLDKAVPVALASRFGNAGQSCIAAKRFILAEPIARDFIEAFEAGAREIVAGEPLDAATTLGPMARSDLREGLARRVERALAEGARATLGGKPCEGQGFFYPPTILLDVTPDSAAAQEEMFGPVATFFTFGRREEAIRLANDTPYGLGAGVWTRDFEAGWLFANEIDAGAVFVNDLVRSDPRAPFGGIKASGYGRELGELGIREFTNAKLKWLA